jgi:hypothetical protein
MSVLKLNPMNPIPQLIQSIVAHSAVNIWSTIIVSSRKRFPANFVGINRPSIPNSLDILEKISALYTCTRTEYTFQTIP